YLLALPRSVTSSSWRTLSRLKLLRKSFKGTEVRVHAPATEGSPQARERRRRGRPGGWPPFRHRWDIRSMHRDCKLHPTLWTPPDDRFYLEVRCRTSQLSAFLSEAIVLLGENVPEQVWMVLRSGLVAWLDKYESSILGASRELGRVTGHHLDCPASFADLSPAFSLVIREAAWDVTQPSLSISQLAETAILVSRISLELLVMHLNGCWDIEDVLLTTWGRNHLQELEASQSVLFVKCTNAGSPFARPTWRPDRLGILARSHQHASAAAADLRRCVVYSYNDHLLEPPPSTRLGVLWYGDWETWEPLDDIDTWFSLADHLGSFHSRDLLAFLKPWSVGCVTWFEDDNGWYLFDIDGIENMEDAVAALSNARLRSSLSHERFREECICCDQYDLLFICARHLLESAPSGRTFGRYRFGVASKTGALPRFHEALFRFSVKKLRTGLDTSEGNLQASQEELAELRAQQLQARTEKAELEQRVQQLEARLRTSETQLGAMSWLFPTFPEVSEFARSIPTLRPFDGNRLLPVLALRFTHKAVNAHFAFGEEHENRQESIFKLFLGFFMGHLKPEELEPLYVFKHQGPDGTMGLYSRNNRRLVALLMFQAVRRDQMVRVPCRVLDSSDQRWEAPGGRRFDQWFHEGYDGGTGLSINPRPGRQREAQHRGYPLFNPARTAIQALHRASSRANDKLAGDLAQMLLRHVHTRTGQGDEETTEHGIAGHEKRFGTEIIPGFLFLTSQFEAKDPAFLKQHGITHLVSVAEESPPVVPLPGKSLHLALRDSPRTDVRCHFDEVFAVIDAAKRFKKGRALIHCHAMKARTGALCS
ncbi:unnamed protein product, partial [Symbiodinium sp. CCMP2456]